MSKKGYGPVFTNTFLLLLPFCMAILVVGCMKEESCSVKPTSSAIDDITGKWKQIKAEQINGGPPALVYDYSCDNIFYAFNEDSVLMVGSDQDDYLGFDYGAYSYLFTKSSDDQIHHKLFINDVEHSCTISEQRIMTIGLEPIPGPFELPYTSTTLYFIRTQ